MPSDNVVFDKNQGPAPFPHPQQQPRTLSQAVMKIGLAGSPGSAALVLALGAAALIGFSIYMLASAVSSPPTLGSDVPLQVSDF